MRWLKAQRAVFGFSLALLLAIGGPFGQTATAQEAKTPKLDVDAPVASLLQASPDTDAQLANLATSLLKARANTEISHSTYQEGVRYFRLNHPQFYGNFFGHPYYATYDVHYLQMARYRSLASTEADPLTGLPGLFSCNPVWYDPAFGGTCEGFKYASSEFLILPSGFSPSRPASSRCSQTVAEGFCMQPVDLAGLIEPNASDNSQRSSAHYDADDREQRGTAGDPPPRDVPSRSENTRPSEDTDHTSRISSIDAPPSSPSVEGEKLAKSPDRTEPALTRVRRIEVPTDVNTSLQRKAAALKRTEAKLHLRRRIQREYGNPRNLSPKERARLTSHLGETMYPNRTEGEISVQGSREREDSKEAVPGSEEARRMSERSILREIKIRRQKNGDRLSAEERREVMSTVQRLADRQNARRVNSRNGRSDRLRRQAESSRDRDHALENRSPRPPSDADQPQTETDRSASEPPRSDRPEARPERSSPPDRSRPTDDSSDDETEN